MKERMKDLRKEIKAKGRSSKTLIGHDKKLGFSFQLTGKSLELWSSEVEDLTYFWISLL